MRLFFILFLFSFTVKASTFTTINSIDNRVYLAQIPDNFNQRVVILFHGAGQQAETLLTNPYTNQFINLLLSSGFGVVLPSARPSFSSRWEAENNNNPDIDFINYVLDHDKLIYNRSVIKSKAIEQIFVMGGSSGGLMASRMALSRIDIAGLILVNGANADQGTLSNGFITVNNNFIIPWYHCPVLNIASTVDNLIPFALKLVYSDKLQAASISSVLFTTDSGQHNWDSWVVPYYSNMIGWLRR